MRFMSVWRGTRKGKIHLHMIDSLHLQDVREWIKEYHTDPKRSFLLTVFEASYGFSVGNYSITLQEKSVVFNRARKSVVRIVKVE